MAKILQVINTSIRDIENRKSNQKIRFLGLVRYLYVLGLKWAKIKVMSLMAEFLHVLSTTLKDIENRKSNQKVRFLGLVKRKANYTSVMHQF